MPGRSGCGLRGARRDAPPSAAYRRSAVVAQLELLMLIARPAIMPPSCDFTARWFASFDSAD